MTLRLAVIGDPVAHSASPALQRGLLAATHVAGTYEAIRVPAGEGARAIDRLRAAGYHGLNVTTPLKEEAFAHAETRDASALAAYSVNTLVLGDRIAGYNMDGIGALGALADEGLADLRGKRILVLGAGPTARAVIAALTACAAGVYVWNRTAARAEELRLRFGGERLRLGVPVQAVFAALPPAATLPDDDALQVALRAAPIFIDANYGERATLAARLGRSGTDGRGMLRHSAAAAFELWRRSFKLETL